MTLFQELYKNYGNLEATYEAVQNGLALPRREDIYNYNRDDLLRMGAAKQAAIDEHNDKMQANLPGEFLSGVAGAWQYDTGTGVGINKALQGYQEVDEDFDPTTATKAVEQDFIFATDLDVLKGAKNQEHFDLLYKDLKGYEEHRLNMNRMGMPTQIAAQLFAEVGNVVNWIPFLNVANKAGRLLKAGDIVRGMVLQGTVNTAEEALINMAYKDRNATSYITSFALGAGLSGLALGGSKLWNQRKFEAGVRINQEADAFALYHTKEKADEIIATAKGGPKSERDWVNSAYLRDKDGNLPKVLEDSMTAKGWDPKDDLDVWVQEFESKGLLPRAKAVIQEKLGLAGFSQTLLGSQSPHIRALGRVLFEHGEGGLGVHKEHTAALEADLEIHRLFSGYLPKYREYKGLFATEAKKVGIDPKEFDRVAYRFIDGQGAYGYDGKLRVPGDNHPLNKLLDEFIPIYKKQDDKLQQHTTAAGVFEAASFSKDTHLFRRHDNGQYLKLTQEFGSAEPIKELIRLSIKADGGVETYSKKVLQKAQTEYKLVSEVFEKRRAKFSDGVDTKKKAVDAETDFVRKTNAEVDLTEALRKLDDFDKANPRPKAPVVKDINVDNIIKRVAEALYNRMYKRSYTNDADANLLSTNNRTLLLETLEDIKADGKLDQADVDHFKYILETSGKDRASDPTKGRIGMDMNVSTSVNGRTIRMTDLLDVDLGAGYISTAKYWVGRSALARKGDHFASEEAINTTLDKASKRAVEGGMDGKEVKKQIDTIRKGIELIKGRPIEDMSSWGAVILRNIRKAVGNAMLGKLGIVQAAETGRAIAAVENSMKLPMIRDLIKGVATGKLDSSELKEIQDHLVGNIGFRHIMNHPDIRADDFGQRVSKFERGQDYMSYYLAKWSGWHRLWTWQNNTLMNGLTQKWYRQVMGGKFPETQMRDLGVDDLLLKDLKDQMSKHSTKTEGLDGTASYVELGLEKWDPAVRRKFAMMLHRKSSNAVQMIMHGETPMWLNTAMGKFLGQFRTFSVGALSKQTTRDYKMLREGDMEGAVALFYGTCTSTMANAVKVGFMAATLQGDARDEYLKKALTPASFLNMTTSYVGSLSPLVEGVNFFGDTLFGDTWGDVMGGRPGVRGKGIMDMVPGISYINKAHRGVSGVSQSILTDKELTGADFKALYGLGPFSNNYAGEILHNSIISPALFKESNYAQYK